MKRYVTIKLLCLVLLVTAALASTGCATMNQLFAFGDGGGSCSGST